MQAAKADIKKLIGNAPFLRGLQPKDFADESFGLPTVTDILRELEKPGRDPRAAFKTAIFQEGVEKISDLKPGMVLEGMVTNVTAISALSSISACTRTGSCMSPPCENSSRTRVRWLSPATS